MTDGAAKVAVIGAGGHAKVVVATLRMAGIEVVAVNDDATALRGRELGGVPVRGPVAAAEVSTGALVIAVGDNRTRRRLAEALGRAPGRRWANAVHPAAIVDPSVAIGPGAVVFAGAVVQTDARLGAHAIVNTGATVDHDCRVGDFAHVAPGVHLGGEVEVGEGAFLGIGCAVVPGIKIGAWATVGAGAVVVGDVEPGATVKGVPAR